MYRNSLKRALDLILSVVLIFVFSPLFVLCALVVLYFDGRPIFFRQTRPGLNEEPFDILKFRTMGTSFQEGRAHDTARITRVGLFLRRTSLDELPQLFNVLRGDLSLVGPRPLLMEYLPLYSERQRKRHAVRPGITGLAQVKGRNALTWEKRLEYDVEYVENLSFLLDVQIILWTIVRVIRRSGIESSEHVTMEEFKGTNGSR